MAARHELSAAWASSSCACWRTLPLPLVRGFGAVLGRLLYFGGACRAGTWSTPTWRCAFPTMDARSSARRIARETFVYVAQAWLDRSWLWHAPREVVRRRLQLTGARDDELAAATSRRSSSRRTSTAWTPAATALTMQQVPRRFIDHLHARSATRWSTPGCCEGAHALRQRAGRSSRADGVKPIVSALRKGGLLYLLPDMNFGPEESIFVPFYGVPAATVPSLSRFARLGRAKVVPVVTRLTPEGYEVRCCRPGQDFPTGRRRGRHRAT